MSTSNCTLSIMVARTDLPFMMHTIPHLVRSCHHQFLRKVLVVDTAPLSGDKVSRPGIGSMEDLRLCCQELIDKGIMDEAVDMDYSSDYRKKVYGKHFGNPHLKPTHNYKGYPILGSIFSLENVPGDYILHFDSDMMLHQDYDFDWIQASIEILEKHEDVMFTRPFTGPPGATGKLMYNRKPCHLDDDGLYRFKQFSSRVFLISREKFKSFLPVPILWKDKPGSWQSKLPDFLRVDLNRYLGIGKLHSWEVMLSKRLQSTRYSRVTLADTRAWTLHPNNRKPEFIDNLPKVIEKMEKGVYPAEQVGWYDFRNEFWF
jgi:hypothetical protein